MQDVNNVFTDLFDTLLATSYEGILIYPDRLPEFWKARYRGNIPGFKPMPFDEIVYDLETLGISVQLSEFGSKEAIVDYSLQDNSMAKLRVKYTRMPNMERIVITRHPAKKN